MNEQIKSFLNKIKTLWTGTSKKAKLLALGAIALILIASFTVTAILNNKTYVPLFENLTQAETTEIMGALSGTSVDVKLDASGNITVPEGDEASVRMQLATAGYPKNGLSYYVIKDNSSMLSTDYERKQYENMQLQERIGASIKTLEGVKDAVVTIAVPTESVFYLKDDQSTTASVIVTMNTGSTLSESQVLGIQNLVAKSVSGLSKDNIALTDGEGNDLIDSASSLMGGTSKIKLTNEIENNIKQKVNNVLAGPYDPSKYKISVTATLNTDTSKKETTAYSPSANGNNTGVTNQESSSLDITGGTSTTGGVAGTTGNTDVTTYANNATASGGAVTGITQDKTYSVSQEVTQTEKTDPTIETVSIGIALDGNALNATEQANLVQLISSASGVAPANITIRSFAFAAQADNVQTQTGSFLTTDRLLIFGAIAGGVLLLLLILLFVATRGRKKKKAKGKGFEASFGPGEDAATDELFGALAADGLPPIETIQPLKDDKKEKVKDFAQTNPEIAAQLFKSWLKNEE
ncbi:flagellar M-ring protein FliF [Acetobacterium paludosum]|uniref:Flagellar M-ring protein n=1 Tax=Acetobacterium paludosum TaxID=52693 RepID=A0A923KWN6_9FIRM|nr:flagellar basal-body MS-ring/collar protein FliF [Acetobacterium paludosum]MBC3888258.1 flagellar M-ring protein FliF [Acetobacterium paludosum]